MSAASLIDVRRRADMLRRDHIQSMSINLRAVLYSRSASVGVGRRRSTLLGVAFAPGRRRQCIKRAIITHLFSGVLALRSAQIGEAGDAI